MDENSIRLLIKEVFPLNSGAYAHGYIRGPKGSDAILLIAVNLERLEDHESEVNFEFLRHVQFLSKSINSETISALVYDVSGGAELTLMKNGFPLRVFFFSEKDTSIPVAIANQVRDLKEREPSFKPDEVFIENRSIHKKIIQSQLESLFEIKGYLYKLRHCQDGFKWLVPPPFSRNKRRAALRLAVLLSLATGLLGFKIFSSTRLGTEKVSIPEITGPSSLQVLTQINNRWPGKGYLKSLAYRLSDRTVSFEGWAESFEAVSNINNALAEGLEFKSVKTIRSVAASNSNPSRIHFSIQGYLRGTGKNGLLESGYTPVKNAEQIIGGIGAAIKGLSIQNISSSRGQANDRLRLEWKGNYGTSLQFMRQLQNAGLVSEVVELRFAQSNNQGNVLSASGHFLWGKGRPGRTLKSAATVDASKNLFENVSPAKPLVQRLNQNPIVNPRELEKTRKESETEMRKRELQNRREQLRVSSIVNNGKEPMALVSDQKSGTATRLMKRGEMLNEWRLESIDEAKGRVTFGDASGETIQVFVGSGSFLKKEISHGK